MSYLLIFFRMFVLEISTQPYTEHRKPFRWSNSGRLFF